ncbi:hypothetical protein QE152_g10910 [Popillia japonica]|uniref:Outer dynein arm-docking complex subunit 4 n=1 Tax=Popillia japonica TaxID=7064 RepID=A0AAW1LTS1_POPJA
MNLIRYFQALELNPAEKNALVARSKCYLLLGQPENGLQDAETALAIDKGFIKAIYQKAESLYYLGDFEHSLMYYHRGLRLRPEHEGFKLGIQKAQKAIENAIGGGFPGSGRSSNVSKSSTRCSTKQNTGSTSNKTQSMTVISGTSPETVDNKSDKTIKTPTVTTSGGKRRQPQRKSKLLRELGADKEFLDNLLNNPDINCKFKEDNHQIMDSIKNAVDFLNKRQEFWRQQLPPSLK